MFDYAGVVGEKPEFVVYGAGGVAYVYACYAAVYEDAVGFAPRVGEGFVHGVVDLGYGFFCFFCFQFLP